MSVSLCNVVATYFTRVGRLQTTSKEDEEKRGEEKSREKKNDKRTGLEPPVSLKRIGCELKTKIELVVTS